jgi:hypothetical protein
MARWRGLAPVIAGDLALPCDASKARKDVSCIFGIRLLRLLRAFLVVFKIASQPFGEEIFSGLMFRHMSCE